jgi:hypothetical protein
VHGVPARAALATLRTMNLYDATVPIFTKMLQGLEHWIVKAIAHAEARKFDPEVYVHSRLAPDQYAFVQQVQAACDTAKMTVAKMTGKEWPSHPDTEKTLDEVRARIRTCLAYLETFSREEFVGSEDRRCSHTWMGGKAMRGGDYLDHFALPNFHFHVTLAYEILRHNGVAIGKTDFLVTLPLID